MWRNPSRHILPHRHGNRWLLYRARLPASCNQAPLWRFSTASLEQDLVCVAGSPEGLEPDIQHSLVAALLEEKQLAAKPCASGPKFIGPPWSQSFSRSARRDRRGSSKRSRRLLEEDRATDNSDNDNALFRFFALYSLFALLFLLRFNAPMLPCKARGLHCRDCRQPVWQQWGERCSTPSCVLQYLASFHGGWGATAIERRSGCNPGFTAGPGGAAE